MTLVCAGAFDTALGLPDSVAEPQMYLPGLNTVRDFGGFGSREIQQGIVILPLLRRQFFTN